MTQFDTIQLAADYLSRKYSTEIPTAYYSHVRKWRDWWRGYYKPFHSYQELGVDNAPKQRELFQMGMGKRVCEDWASILINEKTTITVEDDASSVFLQGDEADNGLGGVLGYNRFWTEANALLEKAFGYGTAAFVLRVENAGADAEGNVIADKSSTVGIEYIDALGILPLGLSRGKITDCAFVSESSKLGKDYMYLETHVRDDAGRYVIENEYFEINNGALIPQALPEGMAERFDTGSSLPWFAFIYPNVVNNMSNQNGLGMSVFANAVDNLKGVDLAFNNFLRDLKLGGKKVFVNKKMTYQAENGYTVTPDDVAQSLFQMIGDDVDFDAKQMIQEYNPTLRTAENKEAMQSQLDYLSFKCGLGNHRFQFDSAGVKTATEYVGERQELVQHASKHAIVIEDALRSLCRAILYIGKTFCGAAVDPETAITVNFEDGFIISEEDRQTRDMQLVQAGIMQPWEYRVKHFGEDEETAKAALESSGDENPFGFVTE